MAPADTILKISEIPKLVGIIWLVKQKLNCNLFKHELKIYIYLNRKPITFKVIYKFARPVNPSNEPPPLKCLIGDESGLIYLLHKLINENETDYDKLQVSIRL
jgi:hypothetical protein